MKNKFNVIGLMSGTSLDGLDIAYVEYRLHNNKWNFRIKNAATKRYTAKWSQALSGAHLLSGEELLALDVKYGHLLGKSCDEFITSHNLPKPDFIASHGHTVFHQPDRGFTFQLGDGNTIHAQSGIPVICDFRSLDVSLGGEGAPLVPAGDRVLFKDYEVCLNMGGIANLSREEKNRRIAFDVCFCNMNLNYLMAKIGKAYDHSGERAASGNVNPALLRSLSRIYAPLRSGRPSLGRELFEKKIKPLLDNEHVSIEDKLATCVESTAMEIADAVLGRRQISMLCTGGGVYNSFLISRLLERVGDRVSILVPEDEIIKYKEALIFGFLGVLRHTGRNNCLKSVTGASRDSSSGLMIGF